jgi:methionyl-tRNA formyltransferase
MLDGQEMAILRARRTGQKCDVPPGTVGEPQDSAALVAAVDEWVLVEDVELAGRQLPPPEVMALGSRLKD